MSRCEVAYADSVLPLICLADERRDRGLTFRLILPEAAHPSRLFLNARWAHLLDPAQPNVTTEHPQHESAHGGLVHVSTFRDQHEIELTVADGGRAFHLRCGSAFPGCGTTRRLPKP